MNLPICALLLFSLIGLSFEKMHFPLFHQCDPEWGNTTMGVLHPNGKGKDDTICHQGCAMSCVAMALNGYNITINGQAATPASLNQWLRNNDGYTCAADDCCNLVLDSVNQLAETQVRSLGEPLVPFLPSLRKMVESELIVIAHVQNRGHFVLVTGISGPESFFVNDPFYKRKEYHYSEIHDILLYDFLQK